MSTTEDGAKPESRLQNAPFRRALAGRPHREATKGGARPGIPLMRGSLPRARSLPHWEGGKQTPLEDQTMAGAYPADKMPPRGRS